MDTKLLEYVIAIAETGSLSEAAERCFVTQSAISQQLKGLRNDGLPALFKKEHRRMALTDAGKIYLNGAREILRIEEQARTRISALSEAKPEELRIAVAPALFRHFCKAVHPLLLRKFPSLSLRIFTAETSRLREALDRGGVDLALIPDIYNQEDFYRYTPLYDDELIFACVPGREPLSLPLALPERHSFLRELCNRALSEQQLRPSVYAECNDADSSLAMALEGVCSALVPKSAIKITGLKLTPFQDSFLYRCVCISRKNTASTILDAVLEIVAHFQEIS